MFAICPLSLHEVRQFCVLHSFRNSRQQAIFKEGSISSIISLRHACVQHAIVFTDISFCSRDLFERGVSSFFLLSKSPRHTAVCLNQISPRATLRLVAHEAVSIPDAAGDVVGALSFCKALLRVLVQSCRQLLSSATSEASLRDGSKHLIEVVHPLSPLTHRSCYQQQVPSSK